MFNKNKQTNMNKKIYMIPTLEVVKIGTQQMLATSDQVGIGTPYSGGTIQARELDEFFE